MTWENSDIIKPHTFKKTNISDLQIIHSGDYGLSVSISEASEPW